MSVELMLEFAAIVMAAALCGALLGVWIGNRRTAITTNLIQGIEAFSKLSEQTAKTTREDIAVLRAALVDTERALISKLEASAAATATALGALQVTLTEGLGEVRTTLARIAGEMTTALAENQGKVTKALTDDLTKLGVSVDAKVTELRTGNEAKFVEIQTKLEASTAAVSTALGAFQVTLTEGLGEVRTAVVRIGGEMTTTLAENQGKITKALTDDLTKLGAGVDAKLTELRAGNEAKLVEIQGIVDQKLQEGIEKRMTESFAKITSQFAEVQQAVGEVKNVASQVGDLKRLFSNVKSRGGWGEAQVKATLDDILPANSYEMNKCVNPATSDAVEFALKMPIQGGPPVYLAVDAKFPMEDYTRLIDAIEAADLAAERSARVALEARIRAEARKIQTKYIAPPHTVEWAVLYLPSEGLYNEVTRNGDLMEAIHRDHRVIIMGPSMLAVMLRTIQLGHYTLAISQKADLIGQILGAVKHEMVDFGNQFRLLEKNVQALGNNIKRGRTRANVITRRLKGVEALEGPAAAEVLELTSDDDELSVENNPDTDAENIE